MLLPVHHWIRVVTMRSTKRDTPCQPAIMARKRQKTEQSVRLPDLEDTPLFSAKQIIDIRQSLLDWYDHNHRVLPWRRNYHSKVASVEGEKGAPLSMPQQQFMYGVWVCEVMSQQTQVPRVVAYFNRWMARWPTVQGLAEATIDEVNEVWSGLGYYRRARYLLEGAQYVMQNLGGVFPGTSAELQKIPGVGSYTGAAMASIAAGEPVAVVDANVMRVLARLRCLDWELKNVKQYSKLANALMDADRPGDFNQAVMELGASVCTVHQAPGCSSCPIQRHCHAYERQERHVSSSTSPSRKGPLVTDFPIKAAKAKRREETAVVCAVQLQPTDSDETFFLLVKRPGNGLLAGLWEFPLQLVDNNSARSNDKQVMDEYLTTSLGMPLSKDGLQIVERRPLGELTHTFSHIHLSLRVEKLTMQGDLSLEEMLEERATGMPALKWVSASEIDGKGLSSSVRKVLTLVQMDSRKQKGSIKQFFRRS